MSVDQILNGEDQGALRDYVAGRLPDAQADAFEQRMLDNPALAREFRIACAMHDGLAELEHRGELASLLAAPRAQPFWARPGFAAAASGLLAAALLGNLWLYGQWQTARSTANRAAPALAAAGPALELRLETTRSGSELTRADAEWSASAAARSVTLSIDASLVPDAAHEVRIAQVQRDGLRVDVLRLGSLLPTADGDLLVELHSTLLPPGDYELLVTNASNPADGTRRFALRVAP